MYNNNNNKNASSLLTLPFSSLLFLQRVCVLIHCRSFSSSSGEKHLFSIIHKYSVQVLHRRMPLSTSLSPLQGGETFNPSVFRKSKYVMVVVKCWSVLSIQAHSSLLSIYSTVRHGGSEVSLSPNKQTLFLDESIVFGIHSFILEGMEWKSNSSFLLFRGKENTLSIYSNRCTKSILK